jgi:hypothetical protein
MDREKKERLERLLNSAPAGVVDHVIALLSAFAPKEAERKPIIVEVTACLDLPSEDAGHAKDILTNWGDPEEIDCGWSMIVTLNPGETLSGFKKTVEMEFDCMGIPAEIMIVEVG